MAGAVLWYLCDGGGSSVVPLCYLCASGLSWSALCYLCANGVLWSGYAACSCGCYHVYATSPSSCCVFHLFYILQISKNYTVCQKFLQETYREKKIVLLFSSNFFCSDQSNTVLGSIRFLSQRLLKIVYFAFSHTYIIVTTTFVHKYFLAISFKSQA